MTLPTDPAARDAMAGEYVLGTLDAHGAGQVAIALASDPLWRKAVDEWEVLLAPLASLAHAERPPPDGWDRIEARITPFRAARTPRRDRSRWLWRGWAILTTLAAAGLAAFILVPRPVPPRVMTVLLTEANGLAFLVDVNRHGELRLTPPPVAPGREIRTPTGRSLQLWALAPGAVAPADLGVLPAELNRTLVVPLARVRPVPGMQVEISLEPPGGSPTGNPSGTIIFYGRLGDVGPDN